MTKRFRRFWDKLSKFSGRIKHNYCRWDPVCGMQATAEFFTTYYRGVRYFFCSEHCQVQFEVNPSLFVRV